VVNYYRSADVVINPSFYESLGMSIIEAMACRCAVVATRVGGVTEVMTDRKDGMLVEPGNAPALAESIMDVLGDACLRESIREAAHRRAIAEFSWDRLSESLGRMYTDIGAMKS
jgi:glycosyltransferase involved in cell wall biosynthesis